MTNYTTGIEFREELIAHESSNDDDNEEYEEYNCNLGSDMD